MLPSPASRFGLIRLRSTGRRSPCGGSGGAGIARSDPLGTAISLSMPESLVADLLLRISAGGTVLSRGCDRPPVGNIPTRPWDPELLRCVDSCGILVLLVAGTLLESRSVPLVAGVVVFPPLSVLTVIMGALCEGLHAILFPLEV